MASTALNDSEITEYFDSDQVVAMKVKQLAQFLRSSQHAVLYTGAGISTSAGISDFRGPNGVWTLRAKGLQASYSHHVRMPTTGHMAIKKLIEEGAVKYLVSQNTDGLHVKSGVPHEKIAELHGNTNKEYCPKCKKVFFRDYHTRSADHVHDHRTGRMCDTCNTELWDSIINFSESLPEEELRNAQRQSRKCDLAIVLGTSLRVTPACQLPLMKKVDGKFVICNLQKTTYDDEADLVIHAKTDHVMTLLMKELSTDIPEYIQEFQFKTLFDQATKTLKITDTTTNLHQLLHHLYVTDTNKNVYQMLIGQRLEVQMPNYEMGMAINMTFDFNILNRFTADIQVAAPCRVIARINTSKSTLTNQTVFNC